MSDAEARAERLAVTFTVNGVEKTVETLPMKRLLDVLREDLALTGTKEGCGEGECGACSVFVDGRLVNSCLIPALQVEGSRVDTIEGLARGGELHAVQRAFLEAGGAQCGICTPGMVLAAVDVLRKHPNPTDEQVREGLAGNLCRCTGYMKIFDSVMTAALAIASRDGEGAA
ncbi:MAG: (2Fe-2S)-binding protein [Myxococcales bacterium]|nr:(2Fe-2S)-binding protein [Myxococcales bacterium]MCB9732113.1 (2Fe-2S)-binding protein [Deltaproteobacteria bacterium]